VARSPRGKGLAVSYASIGLDDDQLEHLADLVAARLGRTDVCTEFVAKLRWPNGPVCPRCRCVEYSYLTTRRVWKCKGCKKQYTVKLGTIFERSPLGLDKWLPAVWLIANSKNGISSHELARSLGVTQKSAWFMLHRIRLAMQTKSFMRLSGEVEVDETFIGGKARNMHKKDRERKITGTGNVDKAAVLGMIERGGHVRAEVIPDVKRKTLQPRVRETVEPGTAIYTDAWHGYTGLDATYSHKTIDHAERYVDGRVHTNTIENFWSLVKRGLNGTYVSVEPFHLFRYLDERVFTFNLRDRTDYGRFEAVLGAAAGRRLTYAEVTGQR
jgi:transposase-like protein